MAGRYKYHQTRMDRKHESSGMKKYSRTRGEKMMERGMDSDYYRKHEKKMGSYGMDSHYFHMLGEDRSAPANLPQQVIYESYPKCEYVNAPKLDDTMGQLDETRGYDVDKIESYPSDTKY